MDILTSSVAPSWKVFRLGQLFHERKTKVSDKDYEPLSVTMKGIVTQLETAAKSDDSENRKLVLKGDFAINSRSDRKGAGGISPLDGSVSLISIVLEPSGIVPEFAHHLLRSTAFQEEFYRWGHGIVADLWTTRYADMKNIRLSLPDRPTQKAIADFLDRETARIDQLIEKKQRLISLLQPRWESLFHVGWEDTSKERVRFKFIATRSQRQIRLEETDEFTPLGLYNRGRGYFKKTPSPGHELGDSTFFWVQEGDLILSGQFAWEGAIALAGEDADGCVVSHRYPVYVGTRGVLTAYLYAYFRTVNGQFLLDNCSRGAAGRNRPLNTNILEREKIPLLPRHIQEEVARLVEQERAIKNVVTASIDLLREFRSALITAAVTGEIDVSTWGKQGTIDRRLDQIEEAASA